MNIIPSELVEAVSYYCSREKCEKFFEDGFEINTQNIKGCTLLMFAVIPDRFGDVNSVSYSELMVDMVMKINE